MIMATTRKYRPDPEGLYLEFHQICVRTGVVHLQRCRSCGAFRHVPRLYCPWRHSKDREFVPVPGAGRIYSLVVNHFTVDPGWVDEVPDVVAVAELDEGPQIVGTLRSDDPHAWKVGDRVQVSVEAQGENFAYLWVDPVID